MGNRRWIILCIAVVSQIASVGALFGVPFVLPALREEFGLSIAQAGTLAGLPALGLLTTLFGWGVVIDRYGERFTMAVSLALTAGCLALLGTADGVFGAGAVLVCVGASGGPVNAAGGRLVMSWFEVRRRGLAMGIRQTAQPLGIGGSAALMPLVAERWGFVAAMTLPAVLAVGMVPLVLVFARPPRTADSAPDGGAEAGSSPTHRDSLAETTARSPYRHAVIWRVHGASMLLGVPQFSVMTYALVYLVSEHGWSAPSAGAAVAVTQACGAMSRMVLGVVSDRMGNRLRPVRVLALLSAAALLLLSLSPALVPEASVPLLLACLVLAVSHNGLTFTAVAETAGMAWSGRAMAAQNSLQALSNTLTPVLMGVVITWLGIDAIYAAAALFCAAAAAVVPAGARARGVCRHSR
ncbi:MFS transporter [Streptomonospora wellingtoniae]|uniref:MFS transporter n=1 Tax=Streptomonospora wellingtoniae TaxID=3075544 RepID=A0ABU2KPW1_9ACTN|nr:MFS transporter [Streptomonospora sp. DSM 45055]MDT0301241.1 MFS transporter [Streptomonospora sp. DSM 45055]